MLLPTALDFLRLQARRRGAEGGLAFAGDILPFAVLADAAESLATWLARRGLGAGHPVGVMAGNVPAMVAMLYATWGIGAVAVPVSVRSKAAEAGALLEHARARALLCDEPHAPLAREIRTEFLQRRECLARAPRDRSRIDGDDEQRPRWLLDGFPRGSGGGAHLVVSVH
jgi:acyl-CoA synthetase (AMP-forming)/AMP-acid ligase II